MAPGAGGGEERKKRLPYMFEYFERSFIILLDNLNIN